MNLPEWARYVARDKGGSLWIYEEKPTNPHGGFWETGGNFKKIPRGLFPDVKWSDAEPTELTPAEDSIIKPNHYLNEDGQDLIEVWYHRYPFHVFEAVLDCIAERYEFRAERKNGDEDLRKADEVRKRKAEYVKRNKEQANQFFFNNEPVLPDDPTYMPMPD